MITPPHSTTAFYSMLLERGAAAPVLTLLGATLVDVERLLVTSKDLASDIQAVNELTAAASVIEAALPTATRSTQHNPLYLPVASDLLDQIDADTTGEITAIAGFNSPFITMTLALKEEGCTMVEGKVVYRPFQLPALHELYMEHTPS